MKFDVQNAIYFLNSNNKKTETLAENQKTYSYSDVLSIVRSAISKNNSSELVSLLEEDSGVVLLKKLISEYIFQNNLICNEHDYEELTEHIFNDMVGFGFLTKYIYDASIEEINCNGYDDIEIVTAKSKYKINDKFSSPQHCIDVIKKMCSLGGVIIDGSEPIKDSYLFSGVRISATIFPIVDKNVGGIFSIRKQKSKSLNAEDLICLGTATKIELDFLQLCLNYGTSMVFAGGTSSGKTTDIGLLLDTVQNDKRIYTIEDTRELNIKKYDDDGNILNSIINTKTRESENSRSIVTAEMLVRNTLRFNPDIIVPSEMRGVEAWATQEAGRTGHTIITTVHANSASSVYTRILTLCMLTGVKLSEELMMNIIIEAFPIAVYKKQLADKSRKYMTIIEAIGYHNGKLEYTTLFRFVVESSHRDKNGIITKIEGKHEKVNCISYELANKLLENGADIEEIKRFANKDWNM